MGQQIKSSAAAYNKLKNKAGHNIALYIPYLGTRTSIHIINFQLMCKASSPKIISRLIQLVHRWWKVISTRPWELPWIRTKVLCVNQSPFNKYKTSYLSQSMYCFFHGLFLVIPMRNMQNWPLWMNNVLKYPQSVVIFGPEAHLRWHLSMNLTKPFRLLKLSKMSYRHFATKLELPVGHPAPCLGLLLLSWCPPSYALSSTTRIWPVYIWRIWSFSLWRYFRRHLMHRLHLVWFCPVVHWDRFMSIASVPVWSLLWLKLSHGLWWS